jgi:hypothetical protein
VQLERLAELGREAIRLGARRQDDDSEDLDLLSARQTLHRAHPKEKDIQRSPSISPNRTAPLANALSSRPSTSFWTGNHRPRDLGPTADQSHRHHAHQTHLTHLEDRIPTASYRQVSSTSEERAMCSSVETNATGVDQTLGLDVDWGSLGDFDMNAVSISLVGNQDGVLIG